MQIGAQGTVVGIDHIPELVEFSVSNTKKNHSAKLQSGQIKYFVADGRMGFAEMAPYDCIHVGVSFIFTPYYDITAFFIIINHHEMVCIY